MEISLLPGSWVSFISKECRDPRFRPNYAVELDIQFKRTVKPISMDVAMERICGIKLSGIKQVVQPVSFRGCDSERACPYPDLR